MCTVHTSYEYKILTLKSDETVYTKNRLKKRSTLYGRTKSTLGISSPRDATSVATSTVNFPCLKPFNVLSLWC